MHRVEEISLLKAEIEALVGERDRATLLWESAVVYSVTLQNQREALKAAVRKIEAEHQAGCRVAADMLRELDREQHANAATVVMLRNDVSAANREIVDLRKQLTEAKANLRQWRGCPSCMEDHPEGTTCPPHEVRATGQAWRQRQTRQWAERARAAEDLARRNAERAEAAEQQLAECRAHNADLALQLEVAGNTIEQDARSAEELKQRLANCLDNYERAQRNSDDDQVIRERAERRLEFLERPWPESDVKCDYERRYFLTRDGADGDPYDDCQVCRAERAEAEAGVMRTALEHYANPQHWGILDDDEACVHEITWYGDGDDGDVARAALASGAGAKAAAVLAAARRYWVAVEAQDNYYEPDPAKNREHDVIREVQDAHDGLLAAVAEPEKGEADHG